MYFTPYKRYDGYWESLCSLRAGLAPILKCRVVLDSKGKYEQIVRDFGTGKMVGSRRAKVTIIEAEKAARRIAVSFIQGEMLKEIQ